MHKTPPPRTRAAAVLLGLLVFFGGCAVSPQTRQSLAAYSQAMGQVEQSADLFLTDFSNGLKVQDEHKRLAGAVPAPRRPAYPAEFVLPDDASVPLSETDKALATTRHALLVLHEYNAALVALAEGQSDQQVRERVSSFGTALNRLATLGGSAIPGVDALTSVAAMVIKVAQDAANRQQLEVAVKRGREPVHDILTWLAKQTPPMYRFSVVGTQQGESKLKDDIRRAAFTLKDMAQRRGPPTDAALAGSMTALQVQLTEIGQRTATQGAMPIPFPFTNGKPAYDASTDAEAKVFVQSMSLNMEKFIELGARQNAYYHLMDKYVATLKQAGQSLDALAESIDRLVNLGDEVTRLLKVAFDLRDAMATYRNPPSASMLP